MRKQLIYVVIVSFFFTEACLFAQFSNHYPAYNSATMQQSSVVAPRTVTPSVVQTYNPALINQNALPPGYTLANGGENLPMQLPAYQQSQVSPQYQASLNAQQYVYQTDTQQQQAYYQAIPQNQQTPVVQQPIQPQPVQQYAQYPQYQQQYPAQSQPQPVVNHIAATSHQSNVDLYRDSVQPAPAAEHPLMPVLQWASRERPRIAQIRDYTAILRKQENINGRLQDGNIMEVKIRHEPFSVYMRFVAPKTLDGQEVLYIAGENNGQMWAHGVGLYKLAGTISLDPLHPRAMAGCRYPLTYVGILNLIDKLLEVGQHDAQYGNCKVYYYENVKMGNRQCLCIEVVHPERQNQFRFHLARIYIDNEHNLPIRYESYDWPKSNGQKPELLEAYSYDNLKINVGLTDEDFNILNRNYNF